MAWVRAAAQSAFDGREVVGLEVGGRPLAVYRLDDGFFATSDTCPHAGGRLSEGCVVEGHVECPVHYALFDIRTGGSDGSVTPRSLAIFPVKVEDGVVYVDLPAGEETTR